jgi:hypothetical protein
MERSAEVQNPDHIFPVHYSFIYPSTASPIPPPSTTSVPALPLPIRHQSSIAPDQSSDGDPSPVPVWVHRSQATPNSTCLIGLGEAKCSKKPNQACCWKGCADCCRRKQATTSEICYVHRQKKITGAAAGGSPVSASASSPIPLENYSSPPALTHSSLQINPGSTSASAPNVSPAQPQSQVKPPVYGRHLSPYISGRFQNVPSAQVPTRIPTYGQVMQSNKALEYVFIWSPKAVSRLL